MKRQVFGTLRFTTNRALLVDGDIPRNFSSGISGDIELLFGIGFTPGAKAPSQFLRLELPSDENAPSLSAVEGEVITVLGNLTKMSVFDATGIETQDPLLLVRTFALHEVIAVRAFEISQ